MIFLLLRTKLEVEEKEEEQRKLEDARVAEVTGFSCSCKGGQSFLHMPIIYEFKISPFFLIFLYLFYCLSLNIKIYHLYVNLINQVNENRLNGRQAVRTCKAI